MANKKSTLFAFTFIFIIAFFLFTPIFSVKANLDSLKFKPQVTIPGSDSFIKGKVKELAPGDTSLMIQYIVAIYKFFVGIAGIIAVFMIVFGGVLWLFSGGSSERISKAKEIIIGSITGLLLAVGSYMILYTINPNLTKFTLSISALNPDSFPAVGSQEAIVCSYGKFKKEKQEDKYFQCSLQFSGSLGNSKLDSDKNCLFARCNDADDVCTNDFIIPICRSRINGSNFFKSGITTLYGGEVNLSLVTFKSDEGYPCGYVYIKQKENSTAPNIPSTFTYEYYIGSDCEDDPVCCSLCFVDKNYPKLDQGSGKDDTNSSYSTTEYKINFPAAKCYDKEGKGYQAQDKW